MTPADVALGVQMRAYRHDPLGFVLDCFPWGQPGPLENETGPDDNQIEFLTALRAEVLARNFDGETPVMPVRMACSSGHGTGKTALGGWIACWILSTRPHSIGKVTAGTAAQLEEATWSAIVYWMEMCVTRHWFEVQARGIYAAESILGPGETATSWKLTAQTCKPEAAQSFAGQHAKGSTSWFLFDEASTVPDKIWKVAYGGIIGDEDMFFAWGQPERNFGEFFNICFGSQRDRWNHRTIDSRTSRFSNKTPVESMSSNTDSTTAPPLRLAKLPRVSGESVDTPRQARLMIC